MSKACLSSGSARIACALSWHKNAVFDLLIARRDLSAACSQDEDSTCTHLTKVKQDDTTISLRLQHMHTTPMALVLYTARMLGKLLCAQLCTEEEQQQQVQQ